MTHWKCSNCNYTFEAEAPPERCPSCKQVCSFSDVTCYIPECGGPGNIDPRLVGKGEGWKAKAKAKVKTGGLRVEAEG